MDFWKIYENAKKKHIGMEEYWLAVSLDYQGENKEYEEMMKWLGEKYDHIHICTKKILVHD